MPAPGRRRLRRLCHHMTAAAGHGPSPSPGGTRAGPDGAFPTFPESFGRFPIQLPCYPERLTGPPPPDACNDRALTDDQIASFRENGWLRLEPFLNAAQLGCASTPHPIDPPHGPPGGTGNREGRGLLSSGRGCRQRLAGCDRCCGDGAQHAPRRVARRARPRQRQLGGLHAARQPAPDLGGGVPALLRDRAHARQDVLRAERLAGGVPVRRRPAAAQAARRRAHRLAFRAPIPPSPITPAAKHSHPLIGRRCAASQDACAFHFDSPIGMTWWLALCGATSHSHLRAVPTTSRALCPLTIRRCAQRRH